MTFFIYIPINFCVIWKYLMIILLQILINFEYQIQFSKYKNKWLQWNFQMDFDFHLKTDFDFHLKTEYDFHFKMDLDFHLKMDLPPFSFEIESMAFLSQKMQQLWKITMEMIGHFIFLLYYWWQYVGGVGGCSGVLVVGGVLVVLVVCWRWCVGRCDVVLLVVEVCWWWW